MPFPMRIQPIDSIPNDVVKPPVLKSRLKRLFDRPFNSVLRISSAEKGNVVGEKEFEPSSVCLDKMVQSYIEESNNEKHSAAANRNRYNCFNVNSNDCSDDELDFWFDSLTPNSSFNDPSDTLKSLTPCASMVERNLLADTSKIVEKHNKNCKRKDDLRKVVTDGLIALGYDASVCKSKWEKSGPVPAGEYEYIDVMIEGERVLIDVDFRSEFEIARSTSSYKAILQCLPHIFVGKSDRLLQIVSIASEAARQSLKKKGMHIAPWRKSEYMKSKWLSPCNRDRKDVVQMETHESQPDTKPCNNQEVLECEVGELDLIFGEKSPSGVESSVQEEVKSPAVDVTVGMTWQLPAVRPKSLERVNKVVVTGLASLLNEKL